VSGWHVRRGAYSGVRSAALMVSGARRFQRPKQFTFSHCVQLRHCLGSLSYWFQRSCRGSATQRAGTWAQPAFGALRDGSIVSDNKLPKPVSTCLGVLSWAVVKYATTGEAITSEKSHYRNERAALKNNTSCCYRKYRCLQLTLPLIFRTSAYRRQADYPAMSQMCHFRTFAGVLLNFTATPILVQFGP
jgi:hypothetical protein